MENNENVEKKGCCQGCDKCNIHGGCGGCCSGSGHGCHFRGRWIVRKVILIILMVVIFCLGMQLGELKSEGRDGRFYKNGMMNWNYKNILPANSATGTITVPVTPPPAQ